MRIRSLSIGNFRAIERFDACDLGDFVLIAGPNGCGKTTVLDAVRLVKSIYVHDEWKRWFNEFGVNPDQPVNWSTLFRNNALPVEVGARFVLSETEREFLLTRAANISLAITLNNMLDRRVSIPVTGEMPLMPPDIGARESEIQKEAQDLATNIQQSLSKSAEFVAGITLEPTPSIIQAPCSVATAAFTCFNPGNIGEVEFHTSRRIYVRESVDNIRLRITSRNEERRNRFLYDLENKYRNIKSQLGEEFVASRLKGVDTNKAPLQNSIKELFRTFFPGKEFLGVQLAEDNSLLFPVKLGTGESHDIDELSSGEKEIVYGYLGLRTGTPNRSVILVDEPELHLNPALVQGLPSFYQTHLAEALDAQVWVVTHSDAILRQAVKKTNMSVFHMARAAGDGSQQGIRISNQDAVEAAVIDLIGDLAAYRPYAKIVLIEGRKETHFDVDMIRRLFPELAERANIIPVGNRRMTSGVQVRLLEVLEQSGLTQRAVSISDGDLGLAADSSIPGHFNWPVYEIENFLLEPSVIRGAAEILLRRDPYSDDDEVVQTLRELASELLDKLALDVVQDSLNNEFVSGIKIRGTAEDAVNQLVQSASNSQHQINTLDVSESRVKRLFEEARRRIQGYLASDEFMKRFPGDRLLRAIAGRISIYGDHFRNACLDQAQRLGLRPVGMEQTLLQALK